MAKLTGGINGSFSGTLGVIIGSSWNGIPYIKGPYKKRTKTISLLEKHNRVRFALAHSWLKPLLPFVRKTFSNYSPAIHGFNAAKSYLLKNAIEGTAPDFFVNPAHVKLSMGTLPLPHHIIAEKSGPGEIKFSWDPSSGGGTTHDQVMLLAYDPKERRSHYILTGQFRQTGEERLAVSPGLTYQLYLAFVSVDRSIYSDSVYLGEMGM